MDKYNPSQFEILGIDRVLVEELTGQVKRFIIKRKEKYARIIIKKNIWIKIHKINVKQELTQGKNV